MNYVRACMGKMNSNNNNSRATLTAPIGSFVSGRRASRVETGRAGRRVRAIGRCLDSAGRAAQFPAPSSSARRSARRNKDGGLRSRVTILLMVKESPAARSGDQTPPPPRGCWEVSDVCAKAEGWGTFSGVSGSHCPSPLFITPFFQRWG